MVAPAVFISFSPSGFLNPNKMKGPLITRIPDMEGLRAEARQLLKTADLRIGEYEAIYFTLHSKNCEELRELIGYLERNQDPHQINNSTRPLWYDKIK